MRAMRRYTGRPGLVRARKRLGMSQEAAAEVVGVTPRTWGRWERGDQGVRPVYRRRLAVMFDVDPAEVERWLEGETLTPATKLSPMTDFGRGSLVATVRTAEHLWRCDMDLSRRHVLTALPFVPTALGEWLSGWAYDTPGSPAVHESAAPSVGFGDVTRINEARHAFEQMDNQFGAALVRPAVVDYLNTDVGPLLRGQYGGKVGPSLMTAAAGMTEMAGWTAFDLGHQGLAQYYLGQALKLSQAGDDPMMVVRALSTLTVQAIHLEQPRWAVRLARASVDAATQAHASPRYMALLLGRQAWAQALQVNLADTRDGHGATEVEHLLTRVEDAYQAGPSERDPRWAYWYGTAALAAETGRVWHLLGEHRRAASCAETAAREYGQAFPRGIQISHVNAAEAYLGMGELERALDLAGASVSMARTLTSSRSLERLQRFSKRLDPYAGTVQVREFRDRMRHELAA
ncbi:helix-turn-helix transcriptional regulator [Sphaerisporangium sp. TRM90804]|uniref:helix-turn-helix transcriptional regulator n=1 Tax=Sphaerisporangium sp. TRM90804 TaxID=3031113 RepID=UPI00244C8117|nr:helix-turn-helix transcriptional regulator [Sphaerisporangium sp. TRM90804]MDH2424927.1 helix-turn-helix transcriptional regulator [Sphaerisporangium sp. TRM90804]